jgi:L-ascorbate 6-phosphate lactonase
MHCFRNFEVAPGALALWFLGQNGFLLKTPAGTLIGIDPYLTNSCAEHNPGHVFNLNRVIPPPLEPEDLDVDFVLFTHSHEDHLDLDTVRRLPGRPTLIGPWEAYEKLRALKLSEDRLKLLHPKQNLSLGEVTVQGVFAIPTDTTDLNHIGVLMTLPGALRFYNTGDTAYSSSLPMLLPEGVDICAICINGGFHNLSHGEASRIVKGINPAIVIPTHFDVMACNQIDPEMFRVSLLHDQVSSSYQRMNNDYIYTYEKR